MDAKLTMVPPPVFSMLSISVCMQRNVPFKLTETILSKLSLDCSANGPTFPQYPRC